MYLLYIYLTKRDRAHTELCRRRLRPQSHAPLPSSLSLVTICTWAIDAWAMSAWAGIASAATRGHSVPVWGHSLSPEGQLCNCSVALPTFTTAERPCLLCRCTEAEAVLWEHPGAASAGGVGPITRDVTASCGCCGWSGLAGRQHLPLVGGWLGSRGGRACSGVAAVSALALGRPYNKQGTVTGQTVQ